MHTKLCLVVAIVALLCALPLVMPELDEEPPPVSTVNNGDLRPFSPLTDGGAQRAAELKAEEAEKAKKQAIRDYCITK